MEAWVVSNGNDSPTKNLSALLDKLATDSDDGLTVIPKSMKQEFPFECIFIMESKIPAEAQCAACHTCCRPGQVSQSAETT